jgi:hypothetical protein
MSDKKIKIMSLSLDEEMHTLIKDSAKKLGHKNSSQLIRDLINKYLPLVVNDKDEIPIIIKVPSEIISDKLELESWLDSKMKLILSKFSNG